MPLGVPRTRRLKRIRDLKLPVPLNAVHALQGVLFASIGLWGMVHRSSFMGEHGSAGPNDNVAPGVQQPHIGPLFTAGNEPLETSAARLNPGICQQNASGEAL